MSKGTVPIIRCDHEYGCDTWAVDYYEMGASVPELHEGWTRIDNFYVLCPDHKDES